LQVGAKIEVIYHLDLRAHLQTRSMAAALVVLKMWAMGSDDTVVGFGILVVKPWALGFGGCGSVAYLLSAVIIAQW
jgi:hypothetical protein